MSPSLRTTQSLPVVRVGEIAGAESAPRRWLVEGLWGAQSVGVIGGALQVLEDVKLGLDMARSRWPRVRPAWVSTPYPSRGRSWSTWLRTPLPVVRERVAGMAARHRGLDLAAVAVHVITPPVLRLDRDPGPHLPLAGDRSGCPDRACSCWIRWCGFTASTRTTRAKWPPCCWRYFRALQTAVRALSVVLVHHTRKNAVGESPPARVRACSSDIRDAFGDLENLYLRRTKDHLVLQSEHRARAGGCRLVLLQLVATEAGDDASGADRRVAGRKTGAALSRSKCWNGLLGARHCRAPGSATTWR